MNLRVVLLIALAVVLQGCGGLRPGYESPTVTISSFKAIPSEAGLPAFEIGLRVVNPNIKPLELRGVAYTISIEGHDIIKGVGNDLPVIDGYGEGEFKLTASANLFAGIRLITDLIRSDKNTFRYEFAAKLDVGAFLPAIRVTDANEISLR